MDNQISSPARVSAEEAKVAADPSQTSNFSADAHAKYCKIPKLKHL